MTTSFRRSTLCEAVQLLWPADRDRDPAGPVQRLGIVGHIDDRETAEVLLGLGERPVLADVALPRSSSIVRVGHPPSLKAIRYLAISSSSAHGSRSNRTRPE